MPAQTLETPDPAQPEAAEALENLLEKLSAASQPYWKSIFLFWLSFCLPYASHIIFFKIEDFENVTGALDSEASHHVLLIVNALSKPLIENH